MLSISCLQFMKIVTRRIASNTKLDYHTDRITKDDLELANIIKNEKQNNPFGKSTSESTLFNMLVSKIYANG